MCLSLADLQAAVDRDCAVQLRVPLAPLDGHKVFPPTYPRAQNQPAGYARERRMIEGQLLTTVLLDSIASQANRMEHAALTLLRARRLTPLPHFVVQFSPAFTEQFGIATLTDLEAPHRLFDAILIDSFLDGTPFPQTDLFHRLTTVHSPHLDYVWLQHAPVALLLGAWDSHTGKSVAILQRRRLLAAEILGWNVHDPELRSGVKPGSRRDPLEIRKIRALYATPEKHPLRWTLDPAAAAKDDHDHPLYYGHPSKTAGYPSTAGHGPIAPSLDDTTGGVALTHARQQAVLSLTALRHLQFLPPGQPTPPDTLQTAGRTLLAALGLVLLASFQTSGYSLRSGCDLIPVDAPQWTLVGPTLSDATSFTCTLDEALTLFRDAYQAATKAGLQWAANPIVLQAGPHLEALVQQSRTSLEPEAADDDTSSSETGD